jgi:hypothetical protein
MMGYITNDKNDTLWSSLPWLGNPGTGGVPVRKSSTIQPTKNQSFQDPTMEVLCHIRPYFVGIFPEINWFLKWPLKEWDSTNKSIQQK